MEKEDVVVLDNDETEEQQHLQQISSEEDETMDIEEIIPKTSFQIAEERKNAGNDQYKAQNYSSALKLYSEAINLSPETAAFYGNRAACYMMVGDYKNALKDSKISTQLDNKFEKGFIRTAKCCIICGDIIGAEQAIKSFLEIDAKNTALKHEIQQLKQLRDYQEKAVVAYDKNDYRTCVYHMDNAIKISPASNRYKLIKAECLAMLGRNDEANDLAINIMQADSSNADAIFVRGLTLYYGDNLDKAILHFERCLQFDPDHKKAKTMRTKTKMIKEKKESGNELFKTGKYREANTIYSEALTIDPNNKEINSKLFYNRALVNTKLGNLKLAISDCTDALKINAKYVKAFLKRAKCQYDLENFEEAVKDYEAALKLEKTVEIKKLVQDAKLQLKKSKRKDYYKILGIMKNATDDEIKKAYRKRALVHHPDRHANSTEDEKREQEKKFKEVGEAYTILSDPNKKSRYDSGQDLDDEYSGHGDFDPNQMFTQFFSYGNGANMFNGNGGGGGPSSFNFRFS